MAQLKAYVVTEPDEGTGGIVFAAHHAVARREGSCEFSDGDWESVECRRAPEFDCFAPGPVPLEVMIEHGWWHDCDYCGRRVNQEAIENGYDDYNADDRFEGFKPGPITPVFVGLDMVYCTAKCEAMHLGESYGRDIYGSAAIAAMRAQVLARFGEVTFRTGDFQEHVYVTFSDGTATVEQCVVAFDFPGMKHGPAYYRLDRKDWRRDGNADAPYYTCCGGDREAFEAFAEATKSQPSAPILAAADALEAAS